MYPGKTFRTKTGYCHILPDKIVLTRDGVIGNMAKVIVGKSITRILVIYGGISIMLFYFAYDYYQQRLAVHAFFSALIGLYLIFAIVRSVHNSATPVIYRDKIRKVRFNGGVTGLTRARFEVQFTDSKGRFRKRLIMLPGSLSGGPQETEKALNIMREEHLLHSS
jgi:hypothetical protein